MIHPLQTSSWAKFRKEWGNEVEFIGRNLIIFSKVPYTNFKIGTIIKGLDIAGSDLALFRKVGKKHNAIFIKFEPNILYDKKLEKDLISWGMVRGKTLFTPTTFIIDLKKSEKELLASFSSKTRYNIRLAQKHGVKVKVDPTSLKLRGASNPFEKYLELMKNTVQRQGFYAHSKKYHQLMWKHLKKAKIAHLLTAIYKGEIITTWILFENDGVLYYPYGASSIKHKKVMANNLMMWEAIKFGKRQGDHTFDLWGREEGKGFTRFKEGYRPEVVKFLGTWDLVINKPVYTIYKFTEMIRWPLLRLKTKFIKPNF